MMSRCRISVPIALLLVAGSLRGADETAGPAVAQRPAGSYADIVLRDRPVGYWRFDGENSSSIQNRADADLADGRVDGAVGLKQPGPRPQQYPLFEKDNAAAAIYGGGGFIRVADPGENSVLDFDNGDAITLEAWVNPQSTGDGRHAYIIGKGRTGNERVARDNQNYALRLTGSGGTARISFLFRNARNRSRDDWHRWTSDSGFVPGTGWHHVAVTYVFGNKDSLRGYIDGRRVSGTWDMGGATDAAPVVDDDELWIGSSMGGSPGSTFNGFLDEIAIYRTALPPERIGRRFRARPREPELADVEVPDNEVLVEIIEGIPAKKSWAFVPSRPVECYTQPAFGFVAYPFKYSPRALRIDRTNPFLLRAVGNVELPAGEHEILLRSRSAARLFVDGELVVQTPFHSINGGGHNPVRDRSQVDLPGLRPLQPGDSEKLATLHSDGGVHRVRLETVVGGKRVRKELGETLVGVRQGDGMFRLLAPELDVSLTDAGWMSHRQDRQAAMEELNAQNRREADTQRDYWKNRHELARRVIAQKPALAVPSVPESLPVHNEIDRFIGHHLVEAEREPTRLAGDWPFLRRACIDVLGTIPTAEQIERFLNDERPGRRARLIDRLLDHPGWADNWVGYWQDVLAENPSILKPTLNNTGPFRWWILESFRDNKPFDRFATELIRMRGSKYQGAPAGFAMASQNDAPMAAKAHIVGQAFLGLEMKCARCHDAPFHDFRQKDLFSVAAMLKRSPQAVPKTSSVPVSDEAAESLLIDITLKPGQQVPPDWPFAELARTAALPDGLLRNPNDPREQLAALVTSPQNERFAKVVVNRMWRRYLGRGLAEPVDDWEQATVSHPALLEYLARELVASGYDLKHVARLILNSHAYQRRPVDEKTAGKRDPYLFAGPVRRRMTAEQVLDSMFVAAGKELRAGELNMDRDGARPYSTFINLGRPERAWEFASLSNERDRPSLSMPYAEPFVTLLKVFGWRAARQGPRTVRDHKATVLQPATLANGIVGRRITRLSDDSALTELALEEQPVEELVRRVFLRMLSRPPTDKERAMFVELLRDGYESRRVDVPPEQVKKHYPRPTGVSWSNHLSPEANEIKLRLENLVQKGDPPSVRLQDDWRKRMEDMLWALLNTPEFVFVP